MPKIHVWKSANFVSQEAAVPFSFNAATQSAGTLHASTKASNMSNPPPIAKLTPRSSQPVSSHG